MAENCDNDLSTIAIFRYFWRVEVIAAIWERPQEQQVALVALSLSWTSVDIFSNLALIIGRLLSRSQKIWRHC